MATLPVLVLDPGHGGDAAAEARARTMRVEPTACSRRTSRSISRAASPCSLQGRVEVVLTRDGDRNLSLSDRAAVARERDADLFVSIHFNGFADPTVDGTETWVRARPSDASRRLAETVLERVVAVTGRRTAG